MAFEYTPVNFGLYDPNDPQSYYNLTHGYYDPNSAPKPKTKPKNQSGGPSIGQGVAGLAASIGVPLAVKGAIKGVGSLLGSGASSGVTSAALSGGTAPLAGTGGYTLATPSLAGDYAASAGLIDAASTGAAAGSAGTAAAGTAGATSAGSAAAGATSAGSAAAGASTLGSLSAAAAPAAVVVGTTLADKYINQPLLGDNYNRPLGLGLRFLSVGGGPILINSLIPKLFDSHGIFGSKKGADQVARDGIRKNLVSAGALSDQGPDAYKLKFSNGGSYDIGLDGGHFKEHEKVINFDDPVHADAVAAASPLVAAFTGGPGKLKDDFTGYFSAGAIQNAKSPTDVFQNIRDEANQLGFNQDSLHQSVNQLHDKQKLNDQDYQTYSGIIDNLYSGYYDQKAQTLVKDKQESVFQLPWDIKKKLI